MSSKSSLFSPTRASETATVAERARPLSCRPRKRGGALGKSATRAPPLCRSQKTSSGFVNPDFPPVPLNFFARKDGILVERLSGCRSGGDKTLNDRSSIRGVLARTRTFRTRPFANRKRPLSVGKPDRNGCHARTDHERRRHARHRNAPLDGHIGHRGSRRPRGLPHQHRRRELLLGSGTSCDAFGWRLTVGNPATRARDTERAPPPANRADTARARLIRTTRPTLSFDAA